MATFTHHTGEKCEAHINECESNPCHHGGTCVDQLNGFICHCHPEWVGPSCEIRKWAHQKTFFYNNDWLSQMECSESDLQWKPAQNEDTLTNMPRHSLYIIIGALCVAFVLMLIILIVGICRISRIEYQGSSRHAYQEFYNCRSIDSELSNAIASIRHARWVKGNVYFIIQCSVWLNSKFILDTNNANFFFHFSFDCMKYIILCQLQILLLCC